jgi:O-glycosyl hydrolase
MKRENNSNRLKVITGILLTALGTAFVVFGCGISGQNTMSDKGSSGSASSDGTSAADKTVRINVSDYQAFNDTDGDGYGEFEGWGTSLCWWANRVGYSDELTAKAAEAFYDKDKGLGLNIGRYNIGGGDNVTDQPLPEEASDFLHASHIKRSDSIVPGYAVDVTRIDLTHETKEYYEKNFERADYECGYAWNYDWDADRNQVNVLNAAADCAGEEFICEAFSNSPPYFMTESGCSSGNVKAAVDNLREDSYHAFACYMADVTEHFYDAGNVRFQSISPMNEPATDYWSAFSQKQEGCHFSPGKSQSRIIEELDKELKNKGLDLIISGSDETSINTAISSFAKLSDPAKAALSRIDTHAYQGNKRDKLKETALKAGKNLWMSEVDNTYSLGAESGAMEAALGFADEIIKDVNGMYPSAWIMWNAADMHIDSENEFDTLTRAEADRILAQGEPFWGVAIADHDAKELLVGKKYYGFGQFTRYIRPGYCIVRSGINTLAAYNPESRDYVVVALNAKADDQIWEFDFEDLDGKLSEVTAIRTSGDMESGENWSDVTDTDNLTMAEKSFSALVKGYSITTYLIRTE